MGEIVIKSPSLLLILILIIGMFKFLGVSPSASIKAISFKLKSEISPFPLRRDLKS